MSIVMRAARKILRVVRFHLRRMAAHRRGILFSKPDYLYLDRFDDSKVLIDVGCGHVAEFSRYVIERYGARAFGVDPTRKHAPFLKEIEDAMNGRFTHVPVAVAAVEGAIAFNESRTNESGSVLADHTNVKSDETVSYDVEAVTLRGLLARVGMTGAEYLKLDLEGAEYDLLEAVQREELLPFQQIFVEFHHHAVDRFSKQDTARIVRALEAMGLTSATFDDHNYLFHWT
jgi:FkbM family methyltransferase